MIYNSLMKKFCRLLDIQKLKDFIPKTVSEFYNTLYSLDSVPKS